MQEEYIPPLLNSSTEVAIEGLSLESFPPELNDCFITQLIVFTFLYVLLALAIVLQFVREGQVRGSHSLSLSSFEFANIVGRSRARDA